eukprot:CAMPEP_0197486408 /NCGR_PEP_ID=MMETSP1311-20131121/1359_1 /TAXON_ID=464262 /ORGANISM="Genus nov. species nov., Strain RCC856" /LENGTH=58 /DNA_ID=CAMNT_0043029491 /DNA_START=17 /DNA_END=193 /DNA_ORIENTATION=-
MQAEGTSVRPSVKKKKKKKKCLFYSPPTLAHFSLFLREKSVDQEMFKRRGKMMEKSKD